MRSEPFINDGSFGVGDGCRRGASAGVVVARTRVVVAAAGEPDGREAAAGAEPRAAAEDLAAAPLAFPLRLPGE